MQRAAHFAALDSAQFVEDGPDALILNVGTSLCVHQPQISMTLSNGTVLLIHLLSVLPCISIHLT